VLDRLVDKDWIVKETDMEDKRSLRIFLGEKAKMLKDELTQEVDDANEEILSDFTHEERVLLKRLLRDMIS
jgi:DNA-binding MarR family transcriptional regulator